MPKNLILIPLESISNTILWQYRVELSTVWRLMRQSVFYNNFYGTSTSTESILTELLNGCSDTFDGLSLFKERNNRNHPWIRDNPKRNSLWATLYGAGYEPFFLIEHYLDAPVKKRTWEQDCNVDNLFASAVKKITQTKAEGKPILLMFRMVISHMAFDDAVKIRAETFADRFRLGYLQLDRVVNKLLSILMELGIWDDSIIVCYGDHGDELWSHGLNKGYCHAIPPYASLNWIPLLIYGSGNQPGISNQIVSMIDLRESLIKLLLPECDPEKLGGANPLPPFRQTPFNGIDAFNECRELAFSQNLFALQLEYTDLERGLTKGYSITDGIYRVVVSSGGNNPKMGGMEFFCDQVAPSNTRNLLNFFVLDANGDIKKFVHPSEADDRGFGLMFNKQAVANLTEVYQKLKKALYDFVRDKERNALRCASDSYHVMPESVFRHARKRSIEE